MKQMEPWLVSSINDEGQRLDAGENLYKRILFRLPSDTATQYLKVRPTNDGGIEVRCSEGLLSIQPDVANAIRIYRREMP